MKAYLFKILTLMAVSSASAFEHDFAKDFALMEKRREIVQDIETLARESCEDCDNERFSLCLATKINMEDNQDHLNVLRSIDNQKALSQRKLAKDLGFSLGKLNYCLKALKDKGLIKINNFRKKEKKIQYFQYIITPAGIAERSRLTINFMKKKMKEYDELKQELEKDKKNVDYY